VLVTVLRFADLDGDFERPTGQLWKMWPPLAPGVVLRTSDDGRVVAVKLGRGLGVWERDTGRLLWSDEYAGTGGFLPDRPELLIRSGQTVSLLRFPEMTTVGKVRLHADTAHRFTSPSSRLLVTVLSDGNGRTGYQVFALLPKPRRLSVVHRPPVGMIWRQPVFGPEERLIVLTETDTTWWMPDEADDPATPATGGPVTIGNLVLHQVDDDTATRHRIRIDLAAGWLPADPQHEDGNAGPYVSFLDEHRLRLEMSGAEAVELPLDGFPDEIELLTVR
jgi:hypothetical protein